MSLPEGSSNSERPDHPATIGVVLAGGLARRMGGDDKALLMLGGRTLLARIVARLRPQCADLVLNANGDRGRFAGYDLPVVADDPPDFAGPLAGILAALDWVAETRPGIGWIASVAADTPFLPGDFVHRLHAARLAAGKPLACAASGGRSHPANGLWPVGLRQDLRRSLVERGQRKVGLWVARHGAAAAEWPIERLDPFLNINTPDELAAAERALALSDQRSEP